MANEKIIDIPTYYQTYVDKEIDLNETPTIPCPFHNEKHGKSFSYSKTLHKWRCFGRCHCGGDVIDLHRLHYQLKTREEAKLSLYRMLGIRVEDTLRFSLEKVEADEAEVHRRHVYATALNLAKTPDDWLELDYIVSKVPYDVQELEVFCTARGIPIQSNLNIL